MRYHCSRVNYKLTSKSNLKKKPATLGNFRGQIATQLCKPPAWVERCSSKLNDLSVSLLEKNLVGGNTLPSVFSHTQTLVYHNKWVASFGHNI